MSKKAIVIYTSKRGSTKQYAEWIAGDLGCEAVAFADPRMKDINLYEYDCIIYGGWMIVFGVGMADETADNYPQVWGYSIGKLDPKNENRSILYILGGKYDPAAVQGMDKFLMKVMKTVLISGSTPDAKSRANFMKDRIENGVDMVFRDNIQSLVKDARKKLEEQ